MADKQNFKLFKENTFKYISALSVAAIITFSSFVPAAAHSNKDAAPDSPSFMKKVMIGNIEYNVNSNILPTSIIGARRETVRILEERRQRLIDLKEKRELTITRELNLHIAHSSEGKQETVVEKKTASKTTSKPAKKPTPKNAANFTEKEIELLSRLVTAEAQGEPFEGKVEVINVILNRVASNEFPNSIRDVIYQPGQFQVVSNGLIDRRKPSKKSRDAVLEAINTPNGRALFFYNPSIATNNWLDSRPTEKVLGNHTFKR